MSEYMYTGRKLSENRNLPVTVSWQSPSNIAIVKYWGKTGNQLPVNPSVSMTLSEARTLMTATAFPSERPGEINMEFWFEGMLNPAFGNRIHKFLASIVPVFPFLEQIHLKLESLNSFPHSTGIASSASAFSSLALCLCSLEAELTGARLAAREFFEKASYVARLGSGSACRSMFPGFVLWGETASLPDSTNLAAVPVPDVHPVFRSLRDSIIIVDKKEKAVSSTEGHSRMAGHPFAKARIEQAHRNTAILLEALKAGDKETFIRITENEALTLHALMMTSDNGFILMLPETVRIITRIQQLRRETGLDICFTLDAGPNIHLLYFNEQAEQVNHLIVEDLLKNIEQIRVIHDRYGNGPELLR